MDKIKAATYRISETSLTQQEVTTPRRQEDQTSYDVTDSYVRPQNNRRLVEAGRMQVISGRQMTSDAVEIDDFVSRSNKAGAVASQKDDSTYLETRMLTPAEAKRHIQAALKRAEEQRKELLDQGILEDDF